MKYLSLIVLLSSLLFSCTDLDDTADIASLLVGTYIGSAQDDFAKVDDVKIIVSRISNTKIRISPAEFNFTTFSFELDLAIKDNIITHTANATGVSFEAKPAKKKIPLKFSTDDPLQSFDGALE